MRVIGLTYTGSNEKHQHYVSWLQQGSEPLTVVTLSAETSTNKGRIEDCDALVLSGGIDTHPGYYNNTNVVYPNMPAAFNEKRDAFEKKLFLYAQQQELPVLGICRGLQLVNCLLGGNLQQDLAGKNSVHKAIVQPDGKQFDKAHGLHITANSLLHEIAGTSRTVVNSAHHQCTDIIAPDLMVSAVSDDNIAEALEWKEKDGKPFLLCVQWHPERMFQFGLSASALSVGIRDRLLASLKNKA